MKNIKILHTVTNAVIFEYTCENNSLITTLEQAILQNADLQYADLQNANLQNANLKDANLQCANLQCANLQYANLQYADLQNANLKDANLQCANLQYANLQCANLRYADLQCANLRYADLRFANLKDANLQYANLQCANLQYANLKDANLRFANLQYANLQYANLQNADLSDDDNTKLWIAETRILPEEGDLIGWKKCKDDVIVKLLIKEGVARSHAFGRKCRAERVTVLDVIGAKQGVSRHDGKTTYRKGDIVVCDQWDNDFKNECTGGIHFFITRIEAENY